MKSIFNDKATIILRAILFDPERKWTVRNFENEFSLGRGYVAEILASLRKKGLVGGTAAGRLAHSKIIDREGLMKEWLSFYRFELNKTYLYYGEGNILKKMKNFIKSKKWDNQYALTLHTGANLISNYVNTDVVYCYLDSEHFDKLSLEIRQAVSLKELKRGGNVYFIRPYYKKSGFFYRQNIKGFSVVSNLQLYLDLYHYPQRGREHAEYLLKVLKEQGINLA